MKTLIRTFAIVALGLSLAATHASAGAYNLSCSANSSGFYTSDSDGGDPYIPASAGVGWYCYSYGGNTSAYVSIVGNGMSVSANAPVNGDNNGSGSVTSGIITIRIGCQTDPNIPGGAAGAGVTVNW
jgi:hypothetical protein